MGGGGSKAAGCVEKKGEAVHVRSREKLQVQAIEMVPISCRSNVLTRKYTTIKCGTNFWDSKKLVPYHNL